MIGNPNPDRTPDNAVHDADLAFKDGRYTVAAGLYRSIAASAHGRAAVWAWHQMAIAERRAGDSDAALVAVRRALAEEQQIGVTHASPQLLLTEGNALAGLRRYEEAVASLSTAIETFRRNGEEQEALYAVVGQARCFAEMGKPDEAEELLRPLSRSGNAAELRSQALNNLAILERRKGNLDGAVRLLTDDLLLCRTLRDRYGEYIAQINLATAMREAGFLVAARHHFSVALFVGGTGDDLPMLDEVRKALRDLDAETDAP